MDDPTPDALALLTQKQRQRFEESVPLRNMYAYARWQMDDLRELAQTKLERDQARAELERAESDAHRFNTALGQRITEVVKLEAEVERLRSALTEAQAEHRIFCKSWDMRQQHDRMSLALVEATALHLADEQSVRNLERQVAALREGIAELMSHASGKPTLESWCKAVAAYDESEHTSEAHDAAVRAPLEAQIKRFESRPVLNLAEHDAMVKAPLEAQIAALLVYFRKLAQAYHNLVHRLNFQFAECKSPTCCEYRDILDVPDDGRQALAQRWDARIRADEREAWAKRAESPDIIRYLKCIRADPYGAAHAALCLFAGVLREGK